MHEYMQSKLHMHVAILGVVDRQTTCTHVVDMCAHNSGSCASYVYFNTLRTHDHDHGHGVALQRQRVAEAKIKLLSMKMSLHPQALSQRCTFHAPGK